MRASICVGTPLAPVSRAQESVARAFILAGALALVAALLAALLIGTRISNPLRRMASVAARVDAGDLRPRIHGGDRGAARGAGARRVLQQHARPSRRRVRGPARVHRRRLPRAAHAADRDQGPARGARRAGAAPRGGGPPGRAARLRGGLADLAPGRRPAGAGAQRADRVPACSSRSRSRASSPSSGTASRCSRPNGASNSGRSRPATLRADPDRLAQALRNLVRNAIEHTEEGSGRVLLHVERAGAGSVRFVVQDDGPGIPAGQREAVFERFHRTDSARNRASGGTGLGLAIVKAIADAHGGTVRASAARDGRRAHRARAARLHAGARLPARARGRGASRHARSRPDASPRPGAACAYLSEPGRRQVLPGLQQRLQPREDLRPAAVDLAVGALAAARRGSPAAGTSRRRVRSPT